jgi:hypothetical protein
VKIDRRKSMNRRRLVEFGGIGVLMGILFAYQAFAYPTVYPTGTTIYDPYLSYSSYILVPEDTKNQNHPSYKVREFAQLSDEVRLIDMNGNVVHSWKVVPTSNKRCRLLPDGHLLIIGNEKWVMEYDWDGNVVWKYDYPGFPHNDVRRLKNGNTLAPCQEAVPKDSMQKVKDVELPWWGTLKRSQVRLISDTLYEVTPDKKIVWEWRAYEYLDLNKFSPVNPITDWIHVNSVAEIPENRWFDTGDTRFKPGNIILNARNLDTVYIIDKETKKLIWEWTHNYSGGLSHCHEPEMIDKGLPGAGNIVLFDNALFPKHRDHNGQSYVIELNPITKDIVWKYETLGYSNIKFFSKTKSSQKRLPNGNTFISEDNTGRIFQITSDGEIAWEYVNRTDVSRASPYAYDYCPQLKALPKPKELRVTPPINPDWQLKPDALR